MRARVFNVALQAVVLAGSVTLGYAVLTTLILKGILQERRHASRKKQPPEPTKKGYYHE